MRDLAEKSGVSANTILRIEQGGQAYLSTVRKLAEALGVEPDRLMPDQPAELVGDQTPA